MSIFNNTASENSSKVQKIINLLGCLMVVLTQAGITLYLPSFLSIQQTFHTTHQMIEFSLTSYMLGYAIPMLMWGGLSDHIGRKYSLFIALLLFTLASVLLAITSSINFFIFLRFLQGAGGGGCAIIGRAAIRDVFEHEKLVRSMSYVSITFIITLGICQVLGGYIEHISHWQNEFWLMGIMGIISFVLVISFFPKTTKNIIPYTNQQAKLFLKNYFAIIKDRNFLLLAIGGGIGYSITVAFHVISPFLFQVKLHLLPIQYGYLGLILSAGYLLGTLITNRLVVKVGISKLIQAGLFAIVGFGLTMFFLAVFGILNVYTIVIPLFFVTIGQALIYPCAMGLALKSYKEYAGYATGLFGFIQQSLASVVAYISTFLPHNTQTSFALVILTIGLIGFLCFFREIQ